MSRAVAIHQPDFLPWMGYFVKVAKCDVLVVMDHVENNPRKAFLCKRVAFQLPGSVGYLGLCLLYTSPSPRDRTRSRMPSSA